MTVLESKSGRQLTMMVMISKCVYNNLSLLSILHSAVKQFQQKRKQTNFVV